jgi:hypothetical protein
MAEQVRPCHILHLLHARKDCLLSYATKLRHGVWHLASPASVLRGCCCRFPAPLIYVSPSTPLLRVSFLSTETSDTSETSETSETMETNVVTQGHPAWGDRYPFPLTVKSTWRSPTMGPISSIGGACDLEAPSVIAWHPEASS